MISYQQFLYMGPDAPYENNHSTEVAYSIYTLQAMHNMFKERTQEQ